MVALEKPRVPPGAMLLGYIQGEWIARCIHLAAILDLAGHLKNGPKRIHKWTDQDCIRILTNCRRAMKPGSKLLPFEALIQPESGPEAKLLDLLMLVGFAGRERTAEEFASLFEVSGFKMTRIIPTEMNMSIIEGASV